MPIKVNVRVVLVILIFQFLLFGCGGGGGGGSIAEFGGGIDGFSFPVRVGELDKSNLVVAELSSGRVLVFNRETAERTDLITFPGFVGTGLNMSGLLVDRKYDENGFVYVYHGTAETGRNVLTRLEIRSGGLAGRLQLRSFTAPSGHNGGGMYQLSNGNILLGIGDGDTAAAAQDPTRLEGKILLLNRDGELQDAENGLPVGVYALGFRNPFGLDGQDDQTIFVADNGPECDDEVNRLVSGGNYGWREGYQCGVNRDGDIAPIYSWSQSQGVTDLLVQNEEILVGHFNTNSLYSLKFRQNYTNIVEERAVILNSGEPIIDLLKLKGGSVIYTTPTSIVPYN